MELEGIVGPQYSGDGGLRTLRLSRDGAQVVRHQFSDAALRGKVFACANQTGVTTQAGLSGTTPALTLYNPKGSTVNAVMLYAGCVMTVVNAAAAVVWLAANTSPIAAAVTGTKAGVCSLIGSEAISQVQAFTAATLPAAPTAICQLGVGLTGAITLLPSMPAIGRYFRGEIVIAPGGAVSFQTSTASGASGFFGEFIWEEAPIT